MGPPVGRAQADSDQREDRRSLSCQDKVYESRSDRPTRSGPVRQDLFRYVLVVVIVVVSVMIVVVMIAMIFVVPVSFVHLPSLLVVVVVRMGPVSASVGWTIPAAGNPDVPTVVNSPVAVDPGIPVSGHRWAYFVAHRRRCSADVDADLPKQWHCQGDCGDSSKKPFHLQIKVSVFSSTLEGTLSSWRCQ
jgi:hypothetical protein